MYMGRLAEGFPHREYSLALANTDLHGLTTTIIYSNVTGASYFVLTPFGSHPHKFSPHARLAVSTFAQPSAMSEALRLKLV
jgi:hypothetical protein